MPGFRDILQRFRPAGAPGAARAVAVPVDRRVRIEAELEPVFEALVDVESDCRATRRAAEEQAQAMEHRAAHRAASVLAEAASSAVALRAHSAAAGRREGRADLARIEATAAQEVTRWRERADRDIPGLVARAVERVRSDIQFTQPPAGGR